MEMCLRSFAISTMCVMISLGMISRTMSLVSSFVVLPFAMKLSECFKSYTKRSRGLMVTFSCLDSSSPFYLTSIVFSKGCYSPKYNGNQ